MSKKYYWHSTNPLGFGESAVKKGDVLPQTFEKDKRLVDWIKAGKVGEEKVRDASAEQKKTIGKLGLKNVELKKEIKELEDRIQNFSDLAEENKVYKDQLETLNKQLNNSILKHEENVAVLQEVIEALEGDSLKRERKDELIDKLEPLINQT